MRSWSAFRLHSSTAKRWAMIMAPASSSARRSASRHPTGVGRYGREGFLHQHGLNFPVTCAVAMRRSTHSRFEILCPTEVWIRWLGKLWTGFATRHGLSLRR